jgi:hypothetical protein
MRGFSSLRIPESGAENIIAQVLAVIRVRPLIVSGFFLDYITGNSRYTNAEGRFR